MTWGQGDLSLPVLVVKAVRIVAGDEKGVKPGMSTTGARARLEGFTLQRQSWKDHEILDKQACQCPLPCLLEGGCRFFFSASSSHRPVTWDHAASWDPWGDSAPGFFVGVLAVPWDKNCGNWRGKGPRADGIASLPGFWGGSCGFLISVPWLSRFLVYIMFLVVFCFFCCGCLLVLSSGIFMAACWRVAGHNQILLLWRRSHVMSKC